jgi:hypothetical protein
MKHLYKGPGVKEGESVIWSVEVGGDDFHCFFLGREAGICVTWKLKRVIYT